MPPKFDTSFSADGMNNPSVLYAFPHDGYALPIVECATTNSWLRVQACLASDFNGRVFCINIGSPVSRKVASYAVRNRHEKCQKACQSHGPNKKDIFVRMNPFRCRFELHWKRYHCSDCWKCRLIDSSHRLSIQYWYAFGFSDLDPGMDQEDLLSICKQQRDSEVDEIFVHVQQGHICDIPLWRPLVPGKTKNTDREDPIDPAIKAQLIDSVRHISLVPKEPLSPFSSSDTESQGSYWEQAAYYSTPPLEPQHIVHVPPEQRVPQFNYFQYSNILTDQQKRQLAEYQCGTTQASSEYFIPWQHFGHQVEDPWVRMELLNDYPYSYG